MRKSHLHALIDASKMDAALKQNCTEMIDSYAKTLAENNIMFPGGFETYFSKYIHFIEESFLSPPPFEHVHYAEKSPIDYYSFALDFVRPLIKKEASTIFGLHNLDAIRESLKNKENVILFANHQTEPDPQIINILLEPIDETFSSSMFFLAGHRVTTDPIAIPFSRGTNICTIFSKKYIDFPPEQKAEKLQYNTKTLATIRDMLNEGGLCLYIAASNGRDRMDETTKTPLVAPFDPANIELFHLIGKQASRPTHFHTLALYTMPILPPPPTISTQLGEKRISGYSAVKLFFGERLDLTNIGTSEDPKLRRIQRGEALTHLVTKMHATLL